MDYYYVQNGLRRSNSAPCILLSCSARLTCCHRLGNGCRIIRPIVIAYTSRPNIVYICFQKPHVRVYVGLYSAYDLGDDWVFVRGGLNQFFHIASLCKIGYQETKDRAKKSQREEKRQTSEGVEVFGFRWGRFWVGDGSLARCVGWKAFQYVAIIWLGRMRRVGIWIMQIRIGSSHCVSAVLRKRWNGKLKI
jgi:hypothetical protein